MLLLDLLLLFLLMVKKKVMIKKMKMKTLIFMKMNPPHPEMMEEMMMTMKTDLHYALARIHLRLPNLREPRGALKEELLIAHILRVSNHTLRRIHQVLTKP